MSNLVFRRGALPDGATFAFEQWLFHTPAFLQLQAQSGWHFFYAINTDDQCIHATFPVHVNGTEVLSPYRSTFGAVQCSDAMSVEQQMQFLRFVLQDLRQADAKRLVIKLPTMCYESSSVQTLAALLFNLGFQCALAEVGACISVNEDSLSKRMHAWEQRKLRQAKDAGLVFGEENINLGGDIYDFIKACRDEKGYDLSMQKQEVLALMHRVAHAVKLYSVRNEDSLAAASIVIQVNRFIRYTFYLAHAKGYDALSPVVLLIEGIYDRCRADGITLLDLGTSAKEGEPNYSLLEFKQRMGGVPSVKLTLEKEM